MASLNLACMLNVLHFLQAFRHLYVLATEPRYVEAIEVDSRASVYVPLSVTMQKHAQVICLLPLVLIWNTGHVPHFLPEQDSVQHGQQ